MDMAKVNKKCSKQKCCKHLCIHCCYMFTDEELPMCREHYTNELSCVTGEYSNVYHECIRHNKNGNCKKYEEDKGKIAEEELLSAIGKYKEVVYSYHSGGCANITHTLIGQLVDSLKPEYEKYLSFYICGNRVCYMYDEDGNETRHYKKWKEDR